MPLLPFIFCLALGKFQKLRKINQTIVVDVKPADQRLHLIFVITDVDPNLVEYLVKLSKVNMPVVIRIDRFRARFNSLRLPLKRQLSLCIHIAPKQL